MKKLLVLLLVLILAGCSVDEAEDTVSVKDVCCPYEICQTDDALEVTVKDGELADVTWTTDVVPQEICAVTTAKKGEYRITGSQEGAAQVTFTAMQNEQIRFVLTVVVDIDAKNQVTLKTHEHREQNDVSVEEDGLNYNWSVDVEGILTFSFIDSEDTWNVLDDEGVLLSKMSTPSGCKFSVQTIASEPCVISLVGEASQRTISVTIESDDGGNLRIASVQEQ